MAKKYKKRILAILLSAVLIADPAVGAVTARAAEWPAEQTLVETAEENDNTDSGVADSNHTNPDEQTNSEEDSDSGNSEEQNDSQESEAEQPKTDAEQPKTDDTTPDTETPTGQEPQEENAGQEPAEENTEQEAESEEGSVSDNTAEETSVSENDLEQTDQADDYNAFSSMPSNYRLSSEQKAMKSALAASMAEFDESQEGETYVERQVFAFAESREEAEAIADAYCAELIEYDEGVAVLKLTQGVSVGRALMAASDMDNNLPAVYPDYYRYAYGEADAQGNTPLTGKETEILQDNATLTVVEEVYETEEVSSEDSMLEDGETDSISEAYAEAMSNPTEPNMQYDSPYYQWQHANVGTAYAWFTARENKGQYIKVAVLDTGVTVSDKDGLHCDIQTDKSSADSTNWMDENGHGTHVAGIIAAKQDDKGGAGIAPQAEIVNVKILGKDGSGSDSNIIQGIEFAISQKVDIINMSLGGIGYNPAMEKVIDEAYHNGIAVFAAAGNDGGSNMCYPAALDHVICVAAIDNNNRRASFSNYGDWVDLSAPGVDIWSTGINDNNNGFARKSGTSQACPVAAGEAAVILSAEEMKSKIPAAKNGQRVDALKKMMQDNAVPVGSGMGAGVTKLTKVFKLSAAAERPQAPTVECFDTSDGTAQSLSIQINAQRGMRVFYTTNGKNPVYRNGKAGTGTNEGTYWATVDVSGEDAAKGTVKAMAVSESGAVSSVISVNWKLKPYVKTIAISGPARVEKKKTIQLKAVVTPTYATRKDLVWTLRTEDGKAVDPALIKIDAKKGKITTTAQAAAGKYIVTATARDNPDASKVAKAEYTIEVIEPNTTIQQIGFQDKPLKPMKKVLWIRQMSAYQTQWDTVDLFDYVTAKEKDLTAKKGTPLKEITDREALGGRLQWSSNKPAVASVDSTGRVSGKRPGTAVITVKANDNLGKKATIKITVKSAVSKITITSDKDKSGGSEVVPAVARGKSITLRASVFPEKPFNKKVYWSIAQGTGNGATAADMKNISIHRTSGKVTVKANAVVGQYVVTAEAADGQGAKETRTISVVGGAINDIVLDRQVDKNVTLYTKYISAEKPQDTTIKVWIKGKREECDLSSYVITSSNESVARVLTASYSPLNTADASLLVRIGADGGKYGKTKIVVASTDGSNKKATCTVTVKGGITRATLTDTLGGTKKVGSLKLFRTGTAAQNTAELYANISGSEGANLQAYDVTSSNPQIVEVTDVDKDTGKITLQASPNAVGKATVTLAATDGSKKKAACTVTVANPVSKILVAPKGSNKNYAARGKTLQLQATLECEYGTVSSKKVAWGIVQDTQKKVTINGSGKITVKKDAAVSYVTVTAKACDGSNAQTKYTVYITNPVKGIGLWADISYYQGNKLLYTRYEKMKTNKKWPVERIPQIAGQTGKCYSYDLDWDNSGDTGLSGGMTVSSSNPKVMSATVRRVNGKLKVALTADQTGEATITVRALDGGGAQVKYKFRVVEP